MRLPVQVTIFSYILTLCLVNALYRPLLRLKGSRKTTFLQLSSKSDDAKQVGRGEWEDWDKEASLDDEFRVYDDDDDEGNATKLHSFLSQVSALQANNASLAQSSPFSTVPVNQQDLNTDVLRRPVGDSVSWDGWREEPPYFDEHDVQDDEGNWGRSEDKQSTKLTTFEIMPNDISDPWKATTSSNHPVPNNEVKRTATDAVLNPSTTDVASLHAELLAINKRLQAVESLLMSPPYGLKDNVQQQIIVHHKNDISSSTQLAFLAGFLVLEAILLSKL